MKLKKYITITDPYGATLGYDGPFAPISHRILVESGQFHGFESVQKLFPSVDAMAQALTAASARGIGIWSSGGLQNLTWTVVLE